MFLRQIKNKTNNFVRISLILTVVLLFFLFFTQKSNAEAAGSLQSCRDSICFKRPTDVAISSDGSFVLIADSSKASEQGIYLRKFVFSKGEFSETQTIKISDGTENIPVIRISLNKNNNKALVYINSNTGEAAVVQVIDLTNNSVKELMSVTSNSLELSEPVFIDTNGKNLLAGTLNSNSPEIITIDTDLDQITSRTKSQDVIQSINISPNFQNAVITFSNISAQSVEVDSLTSQFKTTLTISPSLTFSVDDFLGSVKFDLSGERAVLSSLGGNHVLHFVDLKNNKLVSQILDKELEGVTLSAITPDGKTAVVCGSITDSENDFKIYKVSTLKTSSISVLDSKLFSDGGTVFDIGVTADQNKILLLVLEGAKKKLKVLSFQDLSLFTEVELSDDNTQTELFLDPNSRYAIIPNTFSEPSVSTVTGFNPGPVLKKITPNSALFNESIPFVINGFIDLSRFSNDIKVCFRNTQFCSPKVIVSEAGQVISGLTPKLPDPTLEDVILIAKQVSDGSFFTTKYSGIFQFLRGATIVDNFPPSLTVLAPKESVFYNTRRIVVLGKVDGTGSEIESVLINGKDANLNFEGQLSSTIANFFSDLQFDSDGNFEIKITARDKASNSLEKSLKIKIDTQIPKVSAQIEQLSSNQFKITGTASGTGSEISSVSVNSQPVTFTKSEEVSFSTTTNTVPVLISVLDSAGNRNEIKIVAPVLADTSPPQINITSPAGGQIFKGDATSINVSFTAVDSGSVKEVLLNGSVVPVSPTGQYSQSLTLKPGENLIVVEATDLSGNKSSSSIKETYIPLVSEGGGIQKETVNVKDIPSEKKVVTISPDFNDLNEELINQFIDLSGESKELVDISSAFSVEISNPPPIPEGDEATIEIPEIQGLEAPSAPDELPELPKGFAIATDVSFNENVEGPVEVSDKEKNKDNVALLVDSTGRTFICGFAFLKELGNNSSLKIKNKNYRFQTTDGKPLALTTTITVPIDANVGDATVSILSGNKSLASILLKIAESKEVRVKKKVIAKPQIAEPIKAVMSKSGTKLQLVINGRNFLSRIAIIDSKLEKLVNKSQLFTNVTFVPSEGIKIKKLKLVSPKNLVVTAEIESSIEPGIKLFNVITPKGADIGAVVFPEPLVDGSLETSATPESLILKTE